MPDLFPITLDEQLRCVRREIGMRMRVYPRWVAGKRMTQKTADAEIAAMEAVLKTLESLAVTVERAGVSP